jgi:hypothetical protein
MQADTIQSLLGSCGGSMAEEQIAFLKFLPKASKEQLQFILEHITRDQLNAIGEVCYNAVYGTVDVGDFKRHRDIIRLLADKKTPLTKRRNIVHQRPNIVVKVIRTFLP